MAKEYNKTEGNLREYREDISKAIEVMNRGGVCQ